MALYARFGVPLDTMTGRDVTLQPKMNFKFRVRFVNFGGLESASYSFDASQQLVTVQRPKIEFTANELGTYAGTVKVFNKPRFSALNLRFRDDIANTMGAAAWSQLQRQYDFLNGRYSVSAGAAKFTTIIETLDGVNEARAIDAFVLEGCYINNADFGDLDYSDGNYNHVELALEYDYLGGYYTERDGIDDPEYMMWYVTSSPTAMATSAPLMGTHESDSQNFSSTGGT